jgi:branched-chain amino acid transport system substrate-binding protein
MTSMKFLSPLRTAQVAILSAGLLCVAACGSASGSAAEDAGSSSAGLPAVVNVVSTNPLIGPSGAVGTMANQGYELAIEEINQSKFLGATTISMKTLDTGGNAQTAASQVTQTISDKSVSAIFGSVVSGEAVAQAPIAQKSKVPIVFTQAGSQGVVIGDYTYRLTPLMSAYYPIVKKVIQEQGWKSIGVLYTAANPTLVEVAEKTVPAMAKDLGIEVTASVATQATTQDFNAPVANVLNSHPDGVVLLQIGAANASAMLELRQAGYTGTVVGSVSASANLLAPAGKAGADMVWPADFHPGMPGAASEKFADLYKAKYDETPRNYSAEAYDAMWFLAKSLKAADSADRAALQDGMDKVAAEPFTGALGENLVFKDRDLAVPGVVVRWDGTKENYEYAASDAE